MSCGPGTSIRSRQCNNPPPGPGGKQCTGLPVGNKPCNEGSCPGSTYQTMFRFLGSISILAVSREETENSHSDESDQ